MSKKLGVKPSFSKNPQSFQEISKDYTEENKIEVETVSENPLDEIREISNKFLSLTTEAILDTSIYDKSIYKGRLSEKLQSSHTGITSYLDNALQQAHPNDPESERNVKNTNIQILLEYLKETCVAAFGTPHDFSTKDFTKDLYELCRNDYLQRYNNNKSISDLRGLEQIITPKIKKSYNISNTEKLADLWAEIYENVLEYIHSVYKVQIPRPLLYELQRNDKEDDNRVGNFLKASGISADKIRIVIDTAKVKVLEDFVTAGAHGVSLINTVAEIDAAKQIQNFYIGNRYFYDTHITPPRELTIRLGPYEFGPSNNPTNKYPISVTKIKGDQRNIIMNCNTEAGVSKLANAIVKLGISDSKKVFGRAETPISYEYTPIPEIDKKEIRTILLLAKAAGDKCPIDVIKMLEEEEEVLGKRKLDEIKKKYKDKIFAFSSGDRLAIEAASGKLTMYNRPNGRTDFYVPPYLLVNPDEIIVSRFFSLYHHFCSDEHKDNIKNLLQKLNDTLRESYQKYKYDDLQYMIRYLFILNQKFVERINNNIETLKKIYELIHNYHNNSPDNWKNIIDVIRKEIPSMTFSIVEMDDILFSKTEDDFLGYDGMFKEIYYEKPRVKQLLTNLEVKEITGNKFWELQSPNTLITYREVDSTDILSSYPLDSGYEYYNAGFYYIVDNDNKEYAYPLIVIRLNQKPVAFYIKTEPVNKPDQQKDDKSQQDPGILDEESIVCGLPMLENSSTIIDIIPPYDAFVKTLDSYTLNDLLLYVSQWKGNQFTTVTNINDSGNNLRQSRTSSSFKQNAVKNTLTFYKFLMTAIFILIQQTNVPKKKEVILEDMVNILFGFIEREYESFYIDIIQFLLHNLQPDNNTLIFDYKEEVEISNKDIRKVLKERIFNSIKNEAKIMKKKLKDFKDRIIILKKRKLMNITFKKKKNKTSNVETKRPYITEIADIIEKINEFIKKLDGVIMKPTNTDGYITSYKKLTDIKEEHKGFLNDLNTIPIQKEEKLSEGNSNNKTKKKSKNKTKKNNNVNISL